jgi:hypothetical protein
MAQPRWTFGLYNSTGSLLADLSIASGRQLTYQLNQPTIVSFTLPLTHSAAALVTPGSTYVRAYRENTAGTRTLRFHGPVWIDETATGQGVDTLSVTAMDPLARLGRRTCQPSFTATDRGSIIQQIIATANTDSETGINTTAAVIESSSTITTDYEIETPTILDVINQYADANDGCDTAIIPTEYSGGKIGTLYVYSRRGDTNTDCVFAYGPGTLANSLSINRVRNLDALTNYVSCTEGDSTATWTNATSVTAYGRLDSVISLPGETSLASISARTRRYLDTHDTPDEVAEYRIQPGPRAPRIFDDFDIGDTITLHVRNGVEYTATQRVYACTVSVDDLGVETISSIDTRSA